LQDDASGYEPQYSSISIGYPHANGRSKGSDHAESGSV
jgi:hypothetical protein